MEHLRRMENFAIGKEDVHCVTEFYGADFDGRRLTLHRDMFIDTMKQQAVNISTLGDIVRYMQDPKNIVLQEMITEFWQFVLCLVTIPVSTCTAERSFSALRRLKSYLRSTMTQKRLNAVSILHIHREITEEINVDEIANEFILKNNVRRNTFYY